MGYQIDVKTEAIVIKNIISWFKRHSEKLLFWLQIGVAWPAFFPLFTKVLSRETKALTLTLYITLFSFFVMMLTLAYSSYKEKRERKIKLLIIVYWQLVILSGVLVFISIGRIRWIFGDTLICIGVFSLVIATVAFSHRIWSAKGKVITRLKDPMVRGFIAIWFKAIPQIWFGWTMIHYQYSKDMPLLALLGAHANMWPRFLHIIWIRWKKENRNRTNKGMFIGELANAVTWTAASLVWLYFRIF